MFSQKCASQLNVTICIYLLELKKKRRKTVSMREKYLRIGSPIQEMTMEKNIVVS